MLADLKVAYLEWRLQRLAQNGSGRVYDMGWYDAIQHEWPSLQWTAGAAIPTRAILKKWWDSRARLFSAVGPHNATSKLLSSVPQRKPKSSKSQDSHPPLLGLLDAVQMQISESRQPLEREPREVTAEVAGRPVARMLDCFMCLIVSCDPW